MSRFNRLYNLIMEDKNQEINQKVLDYIDNGQNFDDIPFEQQRQIVANIDQNIEVYGQDARGLYYNVYQFSLASLLKQFAPELYKKYQNENWYDQNVAKEYAAQLKNVDIPNNYAYYSNDKGEQTWQDVANEVWEYYGV